MRALASVLHERGWELTGSDTNPNSIRTLATPAVAVSLDHAAENVSNRTDLVIYSDAIPKDNVELRRAAELGIPTATYFEIAGYLMQMSRGIAVAGTHGKSTTTSMAARILSDAGLDPTVLCGAPELGNPNGGQSGKSDLMLVEACEYRRNFLHLNPRWAAILGIEADHFDCFENLEELERAFEIFAASVSPDGVLLAKHDCLTTRRATRAATCKVETFGFDSPDSSRQSNWSARPIGSTKGRYQFEILRCGTHFCRISMRLAGYHNVLNALAAAALAFHQGVAGRQIAKSLSEYQGLYRRLECLGTWHGVTILDDYAHHPTEVSAALQSIREMYPERRLFCVFQPHQASRTARLLDELAESLENVDCLALAEIFRAREGPAVPGQVTADDLANTARDRGICVSKSRSITDIQEELKNNLQPGDVLVTIGAGDIRRIADGYIHWIREIRAAG
jgi:UDP-N-acetylmuramate--alanine ligase